MQMLGTEVLFGFQLEGTFKEGLARLSPAARFLDLVALSSVMLMLAALIAAPAQHRLVERGDASARLVRVIGTHAALALLFFAVVLGCDGFVVCEYFLGGTVALIVGVSAFLIALSMWFVLGRILRRRVTPPGNLPRFEDTPLHEKIEQMLTEAWVVLPGATGIFGFQLLITLTSPFEDLPQAVRSIHFVAIAMIALAIIILVSPAAIHRVAFSRADDPRSHRLGSLLITIASAPLILGIAADFYVASGRLLGYRPALIIAPILAFMVLTSAWFLLPLSLRRSSRPVRSRPAAEATER
jgi:hypothetical protein